MATSTPALVEDFIAALPKVELHVHLEGSMQPETLRTLATEHRLSHLARPLDELRSWYEFRDFPHFLEVYRQALDVLRTEDDFALLPPKPHAAWPGRTCATQRSTSACATTSSVAFPPTSSSPDSNKDAATPKPSTTSPSGGYRTFPATSARKPVPTPSTRSSPTAPAACSDSASLEPAAKTSLLTEIDSAVAEHNRTPKGQHR